MRMKLRPPWWGHPSEETLHAGWLLTKVQCKEEAA